MHWLTELDFFPRTIENRFVFSLFDLLLSGIVLLAIVRERRVRKGPAPQLKEHFLLFAFLCLGASFGVAAAYEGAALFLRRHLDGRLFDIAAHLLSTIGLLAMAISGCHQGLLLRARLGNQRLVWTAAILSLGSLLFWQAYAPSSTETTLDFISIVLLVLVLVLFYPNRFGGKRLATVAVSFMSLATLLRWIYALAPRSGSATLLWNFEQFCWAASLFVFALAIGEASQDLFGRVFVRLQIAFILLASVMILVMTQTERNDYLTGIRGRSDQVAEFTRAHLDYFRQRNEPPTAAVEQEDFLRRITLGFANLPELKLVRIIAGDQLVSFEVAENGRIQKHIGLRVSSDGGVLGPDDYLLIQKKQLTSGGAVEFYGFPEFLNRYIRKRIVLMFSLFTGMVVFSTVLIGLVVRAAAATIRQQATEIGAQQQRLLQASRLAAIGQLAAGVAHEVNNPATTILSRASFLASQEKFCASDQEDLDAIVSQAQRIAQITRGLLTFSRPQALAMKPVHLEQIVHESLRSLNDLFLGQRICLETGLAPRLPAVLADRLGLERALENIFRNAIEAMPDGGALRVCASTYGSGTLKIEISDTGTGIEPDKLGRIFDPFFTTKDVGKGTGLGLSIAHGIIKEHNGTIRAESTPAAGTTFVITLPTTEESL